MAKAMPVTSSRPQGQPALSVVAAGMRVTGQLDTDGVVKVEGHVQGSIRAGRQVFVAQGGTVEGDIFTREAVVGGQVRGAVFADDRVEVKEDSIVNGDITTQRIVVHEGGEVNGHIRMADPKALAHHLLGSPSALGVTMDEPRVASSTTEGREFHTPAALTRDR